MRLRDVMTTPVLSIPLRTPLQAAAALLVAHGFTGAPVVDDDKRLVGIVTEADLMRGQIPPEGWSGPQPPNPPVDDIMTRSPWAMRPEDDLADVVAMMLDSRTRTLPIVDDGVLVGILSRRDVLRCVARRELTSADVAARRSEGGARPRGSARSS